MLFEVQEKTPIELIPGEVQTRCLIKRGEPMVKYLSCTLPGDWSSRSDEEIVTEILERDYRLTYGNRAEEEERKRVNTLLKGYEQQLKESGEQVAETRKATAFISTQFTAVQADLDNFFEVIVGLAHKVGYELPDGFAEEEEEGDEEHESTSETHTVGDSGTNHPMEGGETDETES